MSASCPSPVRESYDSDSSTSRLSWESATRNLTLGLLSDEAALKLQLPDLEGNTVELKDFRGEETLVLFWNHWMRLLPTAAP